MEIDLIHQYSGLNRSPHNLEVDPSGRLAFGTNTLIGLNKNYKNLNKLELVKAHDKVINSLDWILKDNSIDSDSIGIISGSADKLVKIWELNNENDLNLVESLNHHSAPVTVVTSYTLTVEGKSTHYLVSGGTDGKVIIYKWVPGTPIEVIDTIQFKAVYPLSLSLHELPTNKGEETLILAIGATDTKIHLHTFAPARDTKFAQVLKLNGHEDWVRSLQFTTLDNLQVMLASGGQDRYIRLWRIEQLNDQLIEQKKTIGQTTQLSTRAYQINLPNQAFYLQLDAVLYGHEAPVYSVNWHPKVLKDGKVHQPMELLTASADKSLMIWSPTGPDGVWLYQCQLGEVGGKTAGFFGAKFSSQGDRILANGYGGAVHVWEREKAEPRDNWNSKQGISGHTKSVTGVSWDPLGHYFVTTSLDQTCRAYSFIQNETEQAWHEISRPQIHGYDLKGVQFVKPFQYVSIADEKVLRVFEAPKSIITNLGTLVNDAELINKVDNLENRPLAANLPALGLSNKAIDDESNIPFQVVDDDEDNEGQEAVTTPNRAAGIEGIPFEEDLLQVTLWPEVEKLYGHGYEMVSVANNPNHKLIASACKATDSNSAHIKLYSTEDWRLLQPDLEGHNLTVTQLKFSSNGNYLVSVSRDRSLCLYKRFEPQGKLDHGYKLVFQGQKAHSRIIWDTEFTPDNKYFLTASRDKSVKVWEIKENSGEFEGVGLVETIKFEESVTSMSISNKLIGEGENSKYLIVVGLENGDISALEGSKTGEWKVVKTLDRKFSHQASVNRIEFHPFENTFVTCSEDTSVKVFNISF